VKGLGEGRTEEAWSNVNPYLSIRNRRDIWGLFKHNFNDLVARECTSGAGSRKIQPRIARMERGFAKHISQLTKTKLGGASKGRMGKGKGGGTPLVGLPPITEKLVIARYIRSLIINTMAEEKSVNRKTSDKGRSWQGGGNHDLKSKKRECSAMETALVLNATWTP